MPQESALVKAERVLTPRELEAYQKYLESGKAPLAVSTSGQFFQDRKSTRLNSSH